MALTGRTINGIFARSLAVLACLAAAAGARAQGDGAISQYWGSPTLFNPAAAGGDGDNLRLRGGSRLQWVGMERAPKLFYAAGDMKLGFVSPRLGAGVTLNQEQLGLFTNTGLNAQGSYSLKLLGGELSAGVQAGYFSTKFRGSEVVLPDGAEGSASVDEAIPTSDLVGQTMDFGAGVWYRRKGFWAGVSAQHLFEPVVSLGADMQGAAGSDVAQYELTLGRSLYFMTGGNIALKNTLIEMQPSLLLRSATGGIAGEGDLRLRYNRFVTIGAGYAWQQGVTALLGVEYRNFFAGYSFEYPLSALSRISGGSHELVVGYSLKVDFGGENRHRHKSVRFM